MLQNSASALGCSVYITSSNSSENIPNICFSVTTIKQPIYGSRLYWSEAKLNLTYAPTALWAQRCGEDTEQTLVKLVQQPPEKLSHSRERSCTAVPLIL